jgi:hypothetical protein
MQKQCTANFSQVTEDKWQALLEAARPHEIYVLRTRHASLRGHAIQREWRVQVFETMRETTRNTRPGTIDAHG